MANSHIQIAPAIQPSTTNSADIGGGITPYLEFRKISKSFGSNVVLDQASFRVKQGETVSIMGRSGVGKSVCLQILMGF